MPWKPWKPTHTVNCDLPDCNMTKGTRVRATGEEIVSDEDTAYVAVLEERDGPNGDPWWVKKEDLTGVKR